VAHIGICATECWPPMCGGGPHQNSVAHGSLCATESHNSVAHFFYAPQKATIQWRILDICATEFQNFCGAWVYMRHKNISVEHTLLYAPQNPFLSIASFLVVHARVQMKSRYRRHCCRAEVENLWHILILTYIKGGGIPGPCALRAL